MRIREGGKGRGAVGGAWRRKRRHGTRGRGEECVGWFRARGSGAADRRGWCQAASGGRICHLLSVICHLSVVIGDGAGRAGRKGWLPWGAAQLGCLRPVFWGARRGGRWRAVDGAWRRRGRRRMPRPANPLQEQVSGAPVSAPSAVPQPAVKMGLDTSIIPQLYCGQR